MWTDHGIAVVTAEYDYVNWRRVIGHTDSPTPCSILAVKQPNTLYQYTASLNK